MIIQKGKVSAIFHEQGLSLKPDVLSAIDRQVAKLIEQLAVVNLAKGLKRLKAEDILLASALGVPMSERSGPEAGKGYG